MKRLGVMPNMAARDAVSIGAGSTADSLITAMLTQMERRRQVPDTMGCMRYLGIDYGTKRVGLALSDEAGVMGFPHSVEQNDGGLLDRVVALIERERVAAIVVGDSRDFSGVENPVAKEAKVFAKQLEEKTGIGAIYEPEMLTTQEARRDFEGIRTKGVVDSSAAALILTSYLSRTP